MMNKSDQLKNLSAWCLSHQVTIGVAESITGGYLQFTLSQMPYAHHLFKGGMTLCAGDMENGADKGENNSDDTACRTEAAIMAVKACQLLNSSLGIGIHAGPGIFKQEHQNIRAFMAIVLYGEVIHLQSVTSKAQGSSKRSKALTQAVLKETLSLLLQIDEEGVF